MEQLGVRHAPLIATPENSLVSATGYCVQVCLSGRWTATPTAAQSQAVMGVFAHYNRALQLLAVPPFLTTWYDPWHKASSLSYLLEHWPWNMATQQVSQYFNQISTRVLTLLLNARPELHRLPRHVVHGDVGPGNILYDTDGSAAIIDWTPYYESHLYAVCVTLYWHHVYEPAPQLDMARIYTDMQAYTKEWPLTDAERQLFSAIFLKAATRILLVPLLVHLDIGHSLPYEECAKRAEITASL